MASLELPESVRDLPEADSPYPGFHCWLLEDEDELIVFNEADVDITAPEHTHINDQFSIVINGKVALTIGGKRQTYSRGDTFMIPGGTSHTMKYFKGYRSIEVCTDVNRYFLRPQATLG